MIRATRKGGRKHFSEGIALRPVDGAGNRLKERIAMMVQIKHALICATLMLLPTLALAEDSAQPPSPEDAARDLIAAQDKAGEMKQMGELIAKQVQGQLANSDQASAKSAGAFMRTMMSPDSPPMKKFLDQIEAVQLKIYSADLTPDEMKQVAAFWRSDAHKKFEAVNFKVLAASSAAIAEFQRGMQLAAYENLTKEQPKNPVPWNSLCWHLVTTGGDLNSALEACNTAIKLNPRFANALDSRGLVYLKLGDYQHALADYDTALKLCPRMAGAAYGRGISKMKLGDFAAGSEDIIQGKTANPSLVAQFASYGIK
jgi:tetratricopeptide (TPR) repeat protein